MNRHPRGVKFRCEHAALKHAVESVSDALLRQTHTPCLPGVAIRATGDLLTVTMTSRDVFVSVQIPGSAENADVIVVEKDRLTDALAAETSERWVEIRGLKRPTLWVGETRTRLRSCDAAEYPAPPAVPPALASFEREMFADASQRVAVAAARDGVPGCINSVRIELDRDVLTLVATDGSRIGRARLPVATPPAHTVIGCIPPETIGGALAHGSAPTVDLGASTTDGGTWFTLTCGEIAIASRLDPTGFPEYEPRLSAQPLAHVWFDRDDAVALAGSAAQLASALNTPTVELTLTDGAIALAPRRADAGGTGPAIRARSAGLGGERRIVLAAQPLLDALESVPGTVVLLGLVDPADAAAALIFAPLPDVAVDGWVYRHLLEPVQMKPAPTRPASDALRFTSGATELAVSIAVADLAVDPTLDRDCGVVTVTATATEAEVHREGGSACATVAVPVTAHAGAESLPVHLDNSELRDVLRLLGNGQPDLEATITAKWPTMVTLRLAGYELPLTTREVRRLPSISEPPTVALETDGMDFVGELNRTLIATSDDDDPPATYDSVQLVIRPGAVVLGTTDSRQVAVSHVAAEPLVPEVPTPIPALIDAGLFRRIAPHIGTEPVRFGWTHDPIAIEFGAVRVVARQSIIGNRPFEQMLPLECAGTVTLDPRALRSAASIVAAEWCDLTVTSDGVTVADGDPSSRSVIAAEVDGVEPGTRLVVRPEHLANAVRAFGVRDDITLHLAVDRSQVLVTERGRGPADESGFRYALMTKEDPQS